MFFEAKLIVGEDCNSDTQKIPIGNLDDEKTSKLLKLLRITAWLLRGRDKFMRRNVEGGTLTAGELRRAKLVWDLYIQRKCYSEEIQAIQQRKRTNLGEQLNLQLDHQDILRCYGRYKNANLGDEVKYPKLLPKKEHHTRLVIKDLHSKLFHAGVIQTLVHIRKEYWIPHG